MRTTALEVDPMDGCRSRWPALREFVVAIAGLAVFVAFALAVCSRKPPHADEVIDAEVAVNLVQMGKPVSFAFSYATPGDLAPSGWPAYEYSLAAWLSVWGISRSAVLSFYITIVAIVSLLVLGTIRRTHLVTSAGPRLLLTLAMPLLPALYSVYSKNRYDAVGMLGLALAAFALTESRTWVRYALLICSGLLVGAGGFNVVIASFPLALLLVLCTRWRFLREAALYLTCVTVGLGLAFLLMYLNGTLNDFFECMRLSGVNARAATRGDSVRVRIVELYLFGVLVATACIDRRHELLSIVQRILRRGKFLEPVRHVVTRAAKGTAAASLDAAANFELSATPFLKLLLVGVVAAVLIPTCIGSVGHYNKEYRWISAIPLFVSATIVASHAGSRWLRLAAAAALLPAVLSGLPIRAFYTATEWAEQDYRPIENFVAERITNDDVVFASWPLYYPVKCAGNPAFFGGAFQRMTEAQKRAVTVAFFAGRENGFSLMDPTIDEALVGFGSDWIEVDRLVVPRGQLRSRIPPAPKSTYCYEVRVFRRAEAREASMRLR